MASYTVIFKAERRASHYVAAFLTIPNVADWHLLDFNTKESMEHVGWLLSVWSEHMQNPKEQDLMLQFKKPCQIKLEERCSIVHSWVHNSAFLQGYTCLAPGHCRPLPLLQRISVGCLAVHYVSLMLLSLGGHSSGIHLSFFPSVSHIC